MTDYDELYDEFMEAMANAKPLAEEEIRFLDKIDIVIPENKEEE